MKLKKCSFCPYVGVMYKSKPLCCKNCAMRLKAQQSVEQPAATTKKHIAPFSKKMLAMLAIYRQRRDAFIIAHPICQARAKCAGSRSTEVHHKKGRVGELLIDETFFLATCHACHVFINENNEQAFALGLSESRLAKTEQHD